MTDAEEWRPKVGEEGTIRGRLMTAPKDGDPYVIMDTEHSRLVVHISDLSSIPAPPSPRPAWETLREAAAIMKAECHDAALIECVAERMKAAAAPKPPTLTEAMKRLLQYEGHQVYYAHGKDDSKPCVCGYSAAITAASEALARAEGK